MKNNRKVISNGKRLFDVVFSLITLLLLTPLLLTVMAAIKLESKGPCFYSSKRVGTGYKIFDFYKFRSMSTDADKRLSSILSKNQYAKPTKIKSNTCTECQSLGSMCSPALYIDDEKICENFYKRNLVTEQNGTFIKIKDDPRVTNVGKFIRNTSIDELPQLFNVLKGDMSIVGNRPLPLYEAEQLTTDEWSERFLAPAGITGLWQVEKRGGGEMSEEERKELDNTYAKNHSLIYDIKLIFRTVPALFQSENV